jgi:hypothetical protein
VQTAQLVRRAWVWAALSDGTLVEQLDAALRVFLAHPRRAVVLGPDGKTHRVELHPGYFRLHDSGDFSWAGPEYALAWFEVCRAFPEVLFWAPTRDWIFGPMREVFRRRPHNLALRPSALTVGADAPSASGMSAGTTVMERAGELVAGEGDTTGGGYLGLATFNVRPSDPLGAWVVEAYGRADDPDWIWPWKPTPAPGQRVPTGSGR